MGGGHRDFGGGHLKFPMLQEGGRSKFSWLRNEKGPNRPDKPISGHLKVAFMVEKKYPKGEGHLKFLPPEMGGT